jgi:hypothetical protein
LVLAAAVVAVISTLKSVLDKPGSDRGPFWIY